MIQDEQINCPSCSRQHRIEPAGTEPARCARCDCELEALITIQSAARAHLQAGLRAIRNHQYRYAKEHSEEAWQLINTPEIANSGLIASVLSHDRPATQKWLRRLKYSSRSA